MAWHFLAGRHHKQVAETANPKIEEQATSPSEAPYVGLFNKLKGIKAGDVDVGDLTTSAVNDLYTSLVGIKDATTAQGSLSGLSKASSEFDQLDGLLDKLSPENRKVLMDSVRIDKAQSRSAHGQGARDSWRRRRDQAYG